MDTFFWLPIINLLHPFDVPVENLISFFNKIKLLFVFNAFIFSTLSIKLYKTFLMFFSDK